MIELNINEEVRRRNIERCREKGILIPTFEQMKNPEKIPQKIKDELKNIGLWEINPRNLYRITWKNEPKEKGGLFGPVNFIEFPKQLTGVDAKIIALVGKWFPTGAHKVGATFGCLAPALVTGNFDSTTQKAVWPSTGNYCRGGAFNSKLLGCDSIAILPEQMSKERFDWLKNVATEVIATYGCESNVKEIFDKCNELIKTRNDVVIFNQFDQFGNYLWHYEITADAILEVIEKYIKSGKNLAAYVSATGSAGTIAAGDKLKEQFPNMKIVASEALQCPTILENGFGAHRIEGIGDKHIPWIHNVKNTDAAVAIDDNEPLNLIRLFNEEAGRKFLKNIKVDDYLVDNLDLLGISGCSNLLSAIKTAKYYELTSDDIIVTILTDSMQLYNSRILELREQQGEYSIEKAAIDYYSTLINQKIDNFIELGYKDRKKIHNLKYFTWVEQQGKSVEELNKLWYDKSFWQNLQSLTPTIDRLIEQFNNEVEKG
ncbi:MAG: pyridoxal-phosphate dependent enzyme [Exilispira sp.]|jgi:cysteine synthase|nr:pyridoxal-phosphate dependent enzyme [Exilispira sp.]